MRKHEGTPKGGETRVVPMSGRLHRALVAAGRAVRVVEHPSRAALGGLVVPGVPG